MAKTAPAIETSVRDPRGAETNAPKRGERWDYVNVFSNVATAFNEAADRTGWRRALGSLRCTTAGRFVQGYITEFEASELAASIAFYALLYLFPLLGAVVATIGLLIQDQYWQARVGLVIVQVFPAATWRDSLQGLLGVRNNAGLFGILSLVGLFWLGSSLLANLARAFNRLYGVPPRSPLRQRLLAMGLIVVVAALAIVTVIAASAARIIVNSVQTLLNLRPLGWGLTATLLAFGTGLFSAFMLFLALYWAVPNLRQRFGDVWPGALVAAFLLVAATQLFPLYIRYTPANLYGAVFGLVGLLTTWFYLLAHIVLLGAAINAFRRASRRAAAAGQELSTPECET